MSGRPKKAKSDRRENTLRIRLTDGERKTIDAAAESKALDSSTWARMVILDVAKPTK
jgi:hypothetical protein